MSDLSTAVRGVVDRMLSEVHTCLPGKIETYDYAAGKATVKPLIKKLLRNGETLELPVISGVPVVFPQGAQGSLTFPLESGDGVLLIFTERCLDPWLDTGEDSEPTHRRKFDLTDAIAIPGLLAFNATHPAEANAAVFKLGEIKLKLQDGKAALGTGSAELLDLLDQLIDALISTTVPTSIGPQMLSVSTNGTLAGIKGDLTTIKGTV